MNENARFQIRDEKISIYSLFIKKEQRMKV